MSTRSAFLAEEVEVACGVGDDEAHHDDGEDHRHRIPHGRHDLHGEDDAEKYDEDTQLANAAHGKGSLSEPSKTKTLLIVDMEPQSVNRIPSRGTLPRWFGVRLASPTRSMPCLSKSTMGGVASQSG